MAGSTSKKVVAVRFDREPLYGFVDPQSYLQDSGVEILTSAGSVATVPYSDLKAVCFVRDFDKSAAWAPNRAFANRPKTEGLWLRLHFRDGDSLEGMVANDLMAIDGGGFVLTPPDPGFLNQRIYVPKPALTDVKVLGVVNSPLRRAAKAKGSRDQLKMFD